MYKEIERERNREKQRDIKGVKQRNRNTKIVSQKDKGETERCGKAKKKKQ
jgi:hypothetical protein